MEKEKDKKKTLTISSNFKKKIDSSSLLKKENKKSYSIPNDRKNFSKSTKNLRNVNSPDQNFKNLGNKNKKFTRISIFMNVFNCHVNRTPIEGTIEEIFYKPGKFLNASLDKASKENERNYYKIKSIKGEEIIIVQIAGLIARRIVCEVSRDQKLNQGERIGMIRFGSRVDLFFNNKKTLAKVGQNVTAGESLLAKD